MKNIKYDILNAGLQRQRAIIADFRLRISDVIDRANGSNKDHYDNFYKTFSSETLAEVNILNNEVELAARELEEMRRINCTRRHDKVEYGAVVQTDRMTFFVSASLEKFTVGDNQFFGISVHSPIYSAMRGKKTGDSFKTSNVEYRIEEVF